MPYYVGSNSYHYNAFASALMVGATISLLRYHHRDHYYSHYHYGSDTSGVVAAEDGGAFPPSHANGKPETESVTVTAPMDRYDLSLAITTPSVHPVGSGNGDGAGDVSPLHDGRKISRGWPLTLVVHNATLFGPRSLATAPVAEDGSRRLVVAGIRASDGALPVYVSFAPVVNDVTGGGSSVDYKSDYSLADFCGRMGLVSARSTPSYVRIRTVGPLSLAPARLTPRSV